MKVRVYHNGDDVFIGWKPAGLIPDCRGFALLRRRNGVEEPVSTWVGFEDDESDDGERRSSTDWPIQKYQWTDYMAAPGDTLQYRVVPMVGPDKKNLQADEARASDWTEKITLSARGHAEDGGVLQPGHRRGAVGLAPARRHRPRSEDREAQEDHRDAERLVSQLPHRTRSAPGCSTLLEETRKKKRDVYAALYELDDPAAHRGPGKAGQEGPRRARPTAASRRRARTRTTKPAASSPGRSISTIA